MSIHDNKRAPGEQPAFAHASVLMRKLVQSDGLASIDVGGGFLLAAVARLSTSLSRRELAELFYRYADEFAVPSVTP